MGTFTVTNLNDSGAGSLRAAIAQANGSAGADIIQFQSGLTGTITLATELSITSQITINGDTNGDRKADITISGGDSTRIMQLSAGGDLTLRSLTLTQGNANGDGGAVFVNGGTNLTVIDSTISDSSSDFDGGAIGIANAGTATIVNSTLSGNIATGNGGALHVGGNATLVNATISGNEATGGGGILVDSATVSIHSSTITDNTANAGGGISAIDTSISITNSVVAGNSAPANTDIAELLADINATSSLIGGNPLLGALADNGGPVLTHLPLAGSPLIAAGSAGPLPADSQDIDKDGNTTEPLPLDATGGTRAVGKVEIGAVELATTPLTVNTAVDSETVGASLAADLADGAGLSLREALAWAGSGDTVTFAAGVSTIRLASVLTVSGGVNINGDRNGDGTPDVTISGDTDNNGTGDTSLFFIDGPGAVTLNGLVMTKGFSQALSAGDVAGAIFAGSGTLLTISNSTLSDNRALGFDATAAGADGGGAAGAIFTDGILIVENTLFQNNSGLGGDGATGAPGGLVLPNTPGQTGGIGGEGGRGASDINSISGTVQLLDGVRFDGGTASGGLGGAGGAGSDAINATGGTGGLGGNGGQAGALFIQNNLNLGTAIIVSPATFSGGAAGAGGAGGTGSPPGAPGAAGASGTSDLIVYSGASADIVTAFTVTTLNDVVNASDGVLSLREAIALANETDGPSTIGFASGLAGTITLGGTELEITGDVTINGDTNGDRKADITISGNNASRIFSISGSGTDVVLSSLTLTGGNGGSFGGAIFTSSLTTLAVIDSTISASRAGFGGGISSLGGLTIVNSTLSGNMANGSGGALESYGTTTLVNTTISGNQANLYGGGLITRNGSLELYNSTITANEAYYSGGISIFQAIPVTVTNSIVSGNTGGNDIVSAASSFSATSSIFGNSVTIHDGGGGNIINANPLLGALADNGGPVRTHTPLAGSPLIGAGNAALRPADTQDIDKDGNKTELLPLDAAGNPRVIGTLDIGAVEFAPPVIGSGATATVAENSTAVMTVIATDPANQLINYSIFGGADAAKFGINATTGALAFLAAPDFEAPTDAGGDNIYDVIVRATDSSGLTADRAIAVTVTDVADAPPAGGGDSHTLPSGGTVSGTAAQLFGDTVSGLGTTGTVRFTDTVTKLSDLIITGNEVRLASAGPNSAPLTLQGDFSDGRFFLVKNAAGGSDLFFQKNLADVALVEGRAISEAEVNGAPHPAALTGDGSVRFQVTLSEKATAAHANALGVYEIDANGNIVDVRLLFADVKAAGAGTATIDGVEAGHKLGFFIVADGTAAGAFGFVDTGGGSAQLSDGANLRLQIGGRTVDATVFHAYDKALNADGLVHARSGADPSGHGVRVAFEDLATGGDRDFQDVVFRVDMIDNNGDFLV